MKGLRVTGTNPPQFIGYDDEVGVCFLTVSRNLIAPLYVLDCLEESKAHAAADKVVGFTPRHGGKHAAP